MRKQSLILLNVKALNALFNVVILFVQKLINKNDDTPISSHPKINVTQFPAHNNKIIDKTNIFKKKKKFIIFNSNRIYEYVYKYTLKAIIAVNNEKL